MGRPADEMATATVWVSADYAQWRDISAPVTSVEVEDDERLTDKAVVVLDDSTSVLAHLSFEGLSVRVALGWQAEQARIFEGVVISTRVLAGPAGQTVELTALDHTWLMGRRRYDPMEWRPGETLSTLLKRMVTRPEYRLQPFQIEPATDVKLDERHPARPANVSEWEFILDHAQRQGCLAFAEFDGVDKSNFYFVPIAKVARAKPIGNLHYCRGSGELIEFNYERIGSGAALALEASTIDPTTGAQLNAAPPPPSPRPPLPAPATARDRELGSGRRAAVESLAEVAAAADAKLSRPKGQVSGMAGGTATDLAHRTLSDPTREFGLLGRGVSAGTVLLRAKSRVHITGIAPWAEGEWYVAKVNHVYRRERTSNGTRPSYHVKFNAVR